MQQSKCIIPIIEPFSMNDMASPMKPEIHVTTKTIEIPHTFSVSLATTEIMRVYFSFNGRKLQYSCPTWTEPERIHYNWWISYSGQSMLLGMPQNELDIIKKVFIERLTEAIHILGLLPQEVTVNNSIEVASKELPGVLVKLECPCGRATLCPYEGIRVSLWTIIIHLNDSVGWTRERVADWIDQLHEKGIINAEFQSWEDS